MPTISRQLIERLKGIGVNHVFGVPGDYSFPFYDHLANSEIELVGMTSEINAGHAADAYARVKGIGCVHITYCVGGFSVLNAVACAYAEKSPLVVISGAPGMKERGEDMLLHHMVNSFECQHDVFSKVTCANTVLRNPSLAGYEIDRVLDACRHHRQPVYIEMPRDMVDKNVIYDAWQVGTPPSFTSDPENLKEAVEEAVGWINKASKPVILAGVEIARYGLGNQLIKFAEKINVPVATTIMGKSVINERHPLSLGVYNGHTESLCGQIINDSDCVIMLGVLMTDMNFGWLPKKVSFRNAILSTCADMTISNHSYKKVGFVDFFDAMSKSSYARPRWREMGEKEAKKYVSEPANKLTTKRLFEKINSVLTSNMAIVADVGDSLFGAMGITTNKNAFLSPAYYGTMGFSIPGAIGVQFADKNIRPIVIIGDGAFQMNPLALSTALEHELNPIVVLLNNGGYLTERFYMEGKYNEIRNWNYHKITELIGGGDGDVAHTEGQLDAAMSKAMQSKVPFIINAVVNKDDASPGLQQVIGNLAKKKGFRG